VLRARPGNPAEYEVDFITGREWLPETSLAPATPFPAVTTGFGTFSSAHVARRCLKQAVAETERSYLEHRAPDDSCVRSLSVLLRALSGWSGLRPDSLLRSFSEVLTAKDGQLIAGAAGPRPVTLAAVSAPTSSAVALDGRLDAGRPVAEILPFQKPERPSRAGRRQ
jgi:hypothetical protein